MTTLRPDHFGHTVFARFVARALIFFQPNSLPGPYWSCFLFPIVLYH